ncbi:MAG: AsmA family protein [Balneolaceae bacterium]|nr:AsmA family protein [Balneolaceae bacterium]
MALRYLHKGWKSFWTIILSMLLITVVVGGGIFGLLQLDATKDIIVEKIENDFKKNYAGRLSIGQIEGLLPFNAELNDVVLLSASPDSVQRDTLVDIEKINIGVDVWGIFQNKLSINAFSLEQPSVRLLADGEGSYTLADALKKTEPETTVDQVASSWIKNVEIIAPQVRITDGSMFIEKFYAVSDDVQLPEPFVVDSINAKMFIELTETERFVDIETLTAQAKDLRAGNIEISGQVYNDSRYLEFNAFQFIAGSSNIRFNGTIDGIDVYQGEIREQLADAGYDVEISSNRIKLSEFSDFLTQLPDVEEPLDFSLQTSGKINDLELNTFSLGAGDSYFAINGQVDNLFRQNQLAYQLEIDTLALRKRDAEIFMGPLNAKQYTALENLQLNGQARGSTDSLIVDVSGNSTLGSFTLEGEGQLVAPYGYRGSLTGNNVDIGPLVSGDIDTTQLNFSSTIRGQNTSLTTGTMEFVGSASNSFINHIPIDSLRLTTSLNRGMMEAEYFYRNREQTITGDGTANFNQDDPPITLNGTTKNVNLPTLFVDLPLDSTSLNTSYEIDMQGLEPDRMQGMARFRVEESVIGGDSVRAHQIEVQLDSPDLPSRTLQVNSTLFDLTVTGDLKPSNISNQATYWADYFRERIAQEIRLDSTNYVPQRNPAAVEPLQIKGNIEAKDFTLVRQYWPEFPTITTNSTASFEISADATDLNFSSQIQSDTLTINKVQVKGAGSRLSGQFKHNRTLKEYSNLHFETDAVRLESELFEMDSLGVDLNYRQDSLYYAQRVGRFSENARFNFQMHSVLSDTNITVAIDEFFLGNDSYAWQNEGTPTLIYNRAKEILFESFRFHNQNEFFALRGTFSPDRSDSLLYIIRDVNLGRISDLITGRVDFAGRLNGTLQTRSLTRTPSIQGDLTVNRLQLQDRLVGDVSFSSNFNEQQNRFDTRLEIITDSTKYSDYINANDNIGQNIVLDGYFMPSDIETEQDTVFYFDADFNEIDMWAVQLILDNIFSQLEGRASGSGYIAGNLQDVNFSADLEAENVYARPRFLNTNYYLDGPITLNSEDGVIIKDVSVSDNRGGTGTLSGTVDLNDFKPITYLDLQLQLNDLRFLDNSYDPEVPFFGSLSGTGTVRLTGANTNMQLQSMGSITVSENSTLSIPLLAQTELNTTNNFIQFVDSFENPEQQNANLTGDDLDDGNLDEETIEQALDDLTFNERFNLDLQFNAPKDIAVRLIFDPVTGEILRARGTGRLRITMNNGNVQMFGNYAVSGGSYQFVSGEIFARELDIRPGGSIVWEGPPDNARLDIEAVYHARTSTDFLGGAGSESTTEGASGRIPVDLIVEISGTMSSVENSYYFELPNNFNLTSNSRAQFRINQINRDEQQKLLQATSLLLTGDLLPVQSGTQTASLGQSLSTRNTLVNPLLSNQVISPLLSNQINSLLNSDVSRFDIDFNLNAYNQIDLGIALRLYNDKLILRREGYLAGGNTESTFGDRIGDLNATYRINRNLSITAFHRQDQTLSSFTGPNRNTELTPTVDGVGLEAQVQFNTWQQLSHKVQNFFRRLVGKEEIDFEAREEENKTEATNEEENITEQKNK